MSADFSFNQQTLVILYNGRNGKSKWSKRLSLSNLASGKASE